MTLPPEPATERLNEYERTKRGRFLKRLGSIWRVSRSDADDMLRHDRRSSVRVNRLSPLGAEGARAALQACGVAIEPVPWCPDAFYVIGDRRELAAAEVVQQGHAYIQNASSLVPVLALDPQPGDAVLDVCAAPGGKAAHIAAVTANSGTLWLNDSNGARAAKMEALLSTYRVEPSQITTHRGEYIDKYVEERFDRVLLDAQCSGEGRIDLRHPRALRFWSPGRIAKFANLQKRMIASSYKLVRPGGVMVYATCTFAPEENEQVLDHLLRRFDDAEIEPITIPLPAHRPGLRSWEGHNHNPAVTAAVRVTPSERQEGFFVARVRKAG